MFSSSKGNTALGVDSSSRITRRQRRNLANTNALSKYEADLTSSDRAKQKEAVSRYLAEKIKSDWSFDWPPQAESPSVSSHDSITSDADMNCSPSDEVEWREREEWLSDAAIDIVEDEHGLSLFTSDSRSPINSLSCSENISIERQNSKNKLHALRCKQKEQLEEQLAYNDGLRCFTTRRDIWTGARVMHKLVPTSSVNKSIENSSLELSGKRKSLQDEEYEIEETTELPIGRPILPIDNLVRSSITPRSYNIIYDKVVLNSVTPTCPINLKDIIQSCVQGWKRDGQWPPPSTELVKKISRKQTNRQGIANLFPSDVPDEATEHGETEDKKRERGQGQSQRLRGRARETRGSEVKERNRGLSSCFNRILGRSSLGRAM